jgi:dsRNA-specific ribonuclease
MSSMDRKDGIYFGSRGSEFTNLIIGFLQKGQLRKRYIRLMTDEESIKVYSSAFTSDLVDENNNYQVLEQLGDLSINKFIVSYMYRRFPQLKCAEGVKVVARLRINYGSTESLSEIARRLGFWNFISAPCELRQRKMKSLLEDCFEAIIGATESILDDRIRVGVGYAIVYEILSGIFDEMEISLKYEDLYDAKTRLKELFDMHEQSLGTVLYKETKSDLITISTAYKKYGGQLSKIGEGKAALKANAQQHAAASAIQTLAVQGYKKPVPSIYKKLGVEGIVLENIEVESMALTEWKDDINVLQSTKNKSKYQSKYQSTLLALYCRQRNKFGVKICFDKGADPNIPDSDGMFALDNLFVGKVDEISVQEIFNMICANREKCSDIAKIHKTVCTLYSEEYTIKMINNKTILQVE